MDDITLRERRREVARLRGVHEHVDVAAHLSRVVEDAGHDGPQRQEGLAERPRLDVHLGRAPRERAEGGGEADAHAGHVRGTAGRR